MSANDRIIIPLVVGRGWGAYEAAKRWILAHHPDATHDEYLRACQLAAQMAGV